MSWAPALLSSHLCQPVKRLDDELKPGARPPPQLSAVLKRAMDGRNGRERDRDMGGGGDQSPSHKVFIALPFVKRLGQTQLGCFPQPQERSSQ